MLFVCYINCPELKSFGTILFLYDPKHKLVDILVLKMSVTQGQTLLTSAGVFLTHFSFISGEIIQVWQDVEKYWALNIDKNVT